jgi:hypothetical protein
MNANTRAQVPDQRSPSCGVDRAGRVFLERLPRSASGGAGRGVWRYDPHTRAALGGVKRARRYGIRLGADGNGRAWRGFRWRGFEVIVNLRWVQFCATYKAVVAREAMPHFEIRIRPNTKHRGRLAWTVLRDGEPVRFSAEAYDTPGDAAKAARCVVDEVHPQTGGTIAKISYAIQWEGWLSHFQLSD